MITIMSDNDIERKENANKFLSFATLNRFSVLVEILAESDEKPTLEQAEEAIQSLLGIYGAKSEEQIMISGNTILIETYNKMKARIMSAVENTE